MNGILSPVLGQRVGNEKKNTLHIGRGIVKKHLVIILG